MEIRIEFETRGLKKWTNYVCAFESFYNDDFDKKLQVQIELILAK
ncbi:hypothetical protein LEP1GSC084_1053 [Leptospira interrogans serovar Medanensis str. L0448]|nr:hypothetical protein LEP1GSC099_1425 [Leptospira interrogans str. UI 08452]EMN33169.1 hypothetical protein LEP1GSC084_1053 [Leptospira interrogans serovar Medanensis str. L0448]